MSHSGTVDTCMHFAASANDIKYFMKVKLVLFLLCRDNKRWKARR